MRVWVAFHGLDYTRSLGTIIGVYHTFEAARNRCLEDMGKYSSNYSLTEKSGELIAKWGSEHYTIQSHDVE